jgi:predicted dehydrogenase
MVKVVRWGILGAGRMADRFAIDLKKAAGAEIIGVAARSSQRAQAFAKRHHIPDACDSYEALATHPAIDVIYVATTHNFHRAHTLLCLENGKHVLCEKPLATTADEAQEMVDCARAKQLFLMEAMWSRFNPCHQRAMQWANDGLIGEIRMLQADFGFRGAWEPERRLLNAELAGGSLLDVGVYPLALASQLFGGRPAQVQALAWLGSTGVDEQAGVVMKYPQGQLALLSCAIQTRTPQNAFIIGTKGTIWLPMFWRARFAVLWRAGKLPRITWGRAAFVHEAIEVNRCIEQGKTESATMPLAESLALMKTMDQIRKMIGLQYPEER